jgi:hypothetical protein
MRNNETPGVEDVNLSTPSEIVKEMGVTGDSNRLSPRGLDKVIDAVTLSVREKGEGPNGGLTYAKSLPVYV